MKKFVLTFLFSNILLTGCVYNDSDVKINRYQDEAVVIYHEIEYEIKGNMWKVKSTPKYVTTLEYKGVRHTYYDYNFFVTYEKDDHVVIDVLERYKGDECTEENIFYRDFSLAKYDNR